MRAIPFLSLILFAVSRALGLGEIPAADIHLTDGQDRLVPAKLSDAAEAQSKAMALYAHAMASLEGQEIDTPRAISELRQALVLDPHHAEAEAKIANIFLQTGQVEAAYDELQKAVAKSHPTAELEGLLGYAQHLRGEDDDAVRLSTRALEEDPAQAVSMRVLLEVAGAQDDLSGAVLHIEDILRGKGRAISPACWIDLARLYSEVARNTSASLSEKVMLRTLLPIYQEAASLPPPEVDRLALLAETYEDLGQNERAAAVLREALQLDPENVDLLLRCARLEEAEGNKTASLQFYEKAYRLNPELDGLRDMLSRTYFNAGRYTDAIRVLRDALEAVPGDPDTEADMAVAYAGLHDRAATAAWFARAFASPSCPVEVYLKLAALQMNEGETKKAGTTLARAAILFPQSPRVIFYQAIQYRYAKDYRSAMASLEAMRSLSSPNGDVLDPAYYLECSLTYSLAHAEAKIEPLLKEGLAKFPDNSDLMNELAFSWAEAGEHLAEALALSERACRLDPKDGAIQDTVGWVYYKMGDENAALPYLQRAAILTNNDPVVLEHVGDAWSRLGHRHEALVAWRLALQKDPGNTALSIRINAAQAQATHAHLRSAPHK